MKRKQTHNNTHLSLENRKVIECGIENNSTKADIARTIGKDPTTVAKEIRLHRVLKPRNTFNRPVLCDNFKLCTTKPCIRKCRYFKEPVCSRRDKSPGACNRCDKIKTCIMDKYFYNAIRADAIYHKILVQSREGINLSVEEHKRVGTILSPLLNKGQSIHQVLASHPEINIPERTLYHYIEQGVFKEFGIDFFSLKEKVSRKQYCGKHKIRKEPVNYTGRTYQDFLVFCEEHPDTPITEMDTLYNHPAGPYLQTFLFEKTCFMIGFLKPHKDNPCMSKSIDVLQERLGETLFSRLLSLVLTDRGTEFEKSELFEFSGDTRRLNLFYCDPMQSYQKPHVENNHNYVRDIIPNNYPLEHLSQTDIDLMFSHINSTPRRSLSDKTPYELFNFFHGNGTAEKLNIQHILPDDVTLKPSLIFDKMHKA